MKICILARKRLKFNTRIIRQTVILSRSGFDVTVVSLENPVGELMQLVPTARFLEVQIEPWLITVMRIIRKSVRLCIAGFIIIIFGKKRLLERGKRRLDSHTLPEFGYKILQSLRLYLAPYVNLARTQQFARKANKILANDNFDYCQAHDSFALIAAKKIIRKNKTRLIYDAVEAPDERSGTALSGAQRWFKIIESRRDKKIIRKAIKVYSIGSSLAEWTADKYSISVPTVVRNCCMYWEYSPNHMLRDILHINEDIKLGIIVGSIYQGQGLERLASALKSCNENIHLAAIGPSTQKDYLEYLERYLIELGIKQRFHILPPQPQNFIVSFIAGADFGVIALNQSRLNHRLALPNKLFEYVMARLPIATGNICDVIDIVRHYKIGDVFDENNIDEIVHCINNVSLMKGMINTRNNIEKAAKELCWESEGRTYVNELLNDCSVN